MYYIPFNLEDFKNENPYLADDQVLINLIEKLSYHLLLYEVNDSNQRVTFIELTAILV